MLREKEMKLKMELVNILKEIGSKRDILRNIGKEFIGRGLSGTRYLRDASKVFSDPSTLYTLESSTDTHKFLFLFVFELNKILKEKYDSQFYISIEDYFTEVEYDLWIDYKEDKKQENIFPIIFEDVQEMIEGKQWQTVITSQQLYKLSTENILGYNFNTQRNPKITMFGEEIDFDRRKSIEIKERIINNEQYPDHIKINILHDFNDRLYYNPKNKTLTVEEGSTINIFDGYHRKVGNDLLMQEAPDNNFKWGLIITNLSEVEAKDHMVQINKQTPIKKSQIKQIDFNLHENLTLSAISDSKYALLNTVMCNQNEEVKQNRGLVTKNIIAEAIKDNYQEYIKDKENIRDIGSWIVDFMDYLMKLYSNEFISNKYEVRIESYINNKNMFYGYIALSSELYENDDWKETMKQKMLSINFDKNNPFWKEIGLIGDNNIKNTTKEKIYRLFKEGV